MERTDYMEQLVAWASLLVQHAAQARAFERRGEVMKAIAPRSRASVVAKELENLVLRQQLDLLIAQSKALGHGPTDG
jgi:hypothetical protein